MGIDAVAFNIKRYRNSKGLTQKALAELSEVSLPAIRNLERMKGRPEIDILMALSKVLGCRLWDLIHPIKELTSVRFRARKKMKNREHILAQVSRWLEDFNFLEELLSEKKEYKFSKLAESSEQLTPAQYAAAARKIIGLKDNEPIHNICGLLENAGIKILALPYPSDDFSGLSVGADGPAISINTWEQISVERQIISIAHELGHLLMHLQGYGGSPIEEKEKEHEEEANTFARYFLMPEKGFDSEWAETADLDFVDRVMKVKKIFKVTYTTVLHRLKEKKIIDNSIWKDFPAVYKAKHNKDLVLREEPFPEKEVLFTLDPSDFTTDPFRRLIRKAVEQEEISLSRGAELLHISTERMMRLANKWEPIA